MNLPNGNGNGGRDKTFLIILTILATVMILFGIASMILIAAGEGSDNIALRLINAMGAMFTGLIGLTVGYLTGRGG